MALASASRELGGRQQQGDGQPRRGQEGGCAGLGLGLCGRGSRRLSLIWPVAVDGTWPRPSLGGSRPGSRAPLALDLACWDSRGSWRGGGACTRRPPGVACPWAGSLQAVLPSVSLSPRLACVGPLWLQAVGSSLSCRQGPRPMSWDPRSAGLRCPRPPVARATPRLSARPTPACCLFRPEGACRLWPWWAWVTSSLGSPWGCHRSLPAQLWIQNDFQKDGQGHAQV